MSSKRRFLMVVFSVLGWALVGAKGQAKENDLAFLRRMAPDAAKKHVHFMHLDGYRSDVFEKLLEEGQLPHFAFLLSRGKISYKATTVDKSETMKVIESYLTSQRNTYITGWWEFNRDQFNFKNFWIDPAEVINYELGLSFPNVPTIFDFLANNGKNITAGFSLHRRSVPFQNYTRNFSEGLKAVYNHTHYLQGHSSMTKVLELYERMASHSDESLPVFSTSLMAAADEMAHLKGVTIDNESLISETGEFCVQRKGGKSERASDPYEALFQILDDEQSKPQGLVFLDRTFANENIEFKKGSGHFSSVKFAKKSLFSRALEAKQLCIKVSKIDSFREPSMSRLNTLGEAQKRYVLPEYQLGMILNDIELGRLIQTLRRVRFECPRNFGIGDPIKKCFVSSLPAGIGAYIKAGKLENSMFENTLFIFSGDHGMLDSRYMMAKTTSDLESFGRNTRSMDESFIEGLNKKLALQTPNPEFPTRGETEIGLDDSTVSQEIANYYQIEDWQSEEIKGIVSQGKKWAENFLEKLIDELKDYEYDQYSWLTCLRPFLIDPKIKTKLQPYREKIISVFTKLYLRGERRYIQAEKSALIKFYNDHVRIVYGGAARNNAEIFIPKGNERTGYSWEGRPSYREILDYKGGKASKQSILEVLKTNPGVGLIFIRMNNSEISTQSALASQMKILVTDRFDNQGMIHVLKEPNTGELLYSYKTLTAEDPLHYGDLGKQPNLYRTYNEWNDVSVNEKHYYHNAVAGMGSYLFSDNPSIGDITLMHSQGWNFGDNSGGHGGLHQEEKTTVMIASGPGISPGELFSKAKLRTVLSDGNALPLVSSIFGNERTYPTLVDIAPSVLQWLGYSDEALIEFAKGGFTPHLQRWIQNQQTQFPTQISSIIDEMVQEQIPGLRINFDALRPEFTRLLQFIGVEEPRLKDLPNYRIDGNTLDLEN